MAEVVVYQHGALELVFDTDDMETFETPRDVVTTGRWNWRQLRRGRWPLVGHHEFGPHAHLNITFKPGKQARWREVRQEDAEPFAKPLPRPVPPELADAIRHATWTEL